MDYVGVKQQIVEIFEDVMDVEDVVLEDTTTADDVEEWDSLSHVRLLVAIERSFGISFSNAEIESLTQFGDIVRLVLDKKAA